MQFLNFLNSKILTHPFSHETFLSEEIYGFFIVIWEKLFFYNRKKKSFFFFAYLRKENYASSSMKGTLKEFFSSDSAPKTVWNLVENFEFLINKKCCQILTNSFFKPFFIFDKISEAIIYIDWASSLLNNSRLSTKLSFFLSILHLKSFTKRKHFRSLFRHLSAVWKTIFKDTNED